MYSSVKHFAFKTFLQTLLVCLESILDSRFSECMSQENIFAVLELIVLWLKEGYYYYLLILFFSYYSFYITSVLDPMVI